MCGINGIFNLQHIENPKKYIVQMNQKSVHRGPDFSDIYVDKGIALGHNRLAIIDLNDEANQPFISVDQKYVIVFNGEIYNFKEVKEKLNYNFRTHSDTEVVLAAYLKWGINCLHQFNGMFAFAIWDTEKQELFIARDREGIKPLYYFDNNRNFIFSSELRSLLENPLVDRKLDVDGLVDYLRYNTVHAPRTIIEGVRMLLPGHYIKLSADEYTIKQYWDENLSINRMSENQTYDEVKREVKKRFFEAVERRLVADVPVGAFLSGGIDSSAVVAAMSTVSDASIKTFNVSFAEEEFSEAKYARIIAEKYKTDHTEIKLTPEDFLKDLPEALKAMDHPSGDGPNSYVVSKATKNAGVTVALSGLGGDELFAGYDIFKRAVDLLGKKWMYSFPAGIRKVLGKTLKTVKPSVSSDKIAAVLNQKYLELPYYYPINRQLFEDDFIEKITRNINVGENAVKMIGVNNIDVEEFGFGSPFLSRVSFMEMNTYMQNVLLRDTDQMSMAHALEVRVPFLDHKLIEYVYGIPDQFKYPETPKKLLVDSLGDLLPDSIVNRPKMGFVLPWENWMKNELKEFCETSLHQLDQTGLFEKGALEAMWDKFQSGNKQFTWSRLWPLVVLGNWMKENEIKVG